MENNEIMERLLQDDNHSESSQKNSWAASKSKNEDENSMSKIWVVTAKYRVYIVLLLIFICIFIFETLPNMKDTYNSRRSSYQQVNSELTSVQSEIKIAENDMTLLWEILGNEQSLKTCLNERKKDACLKMPESWMIWDEENKQYDFSIPLSYLQLHSLYNKKMPVDEKKVLKNLNEYLIKQDIEGKSKAKVWDILKISIWDPEAVKKWDEHFFEVPIDVTIEFTTIWDLTGFLYNVEKKLIDEWEDRILYKIQSISYDVVSRDEPQTTDISMLAYYYHDERFENVDEEALVLEENNEAQENEMEERVVPENNETQENTTSQWTWRDSWKRS